MERVSNWNIVLDTEDLRVLYAWLDSIPLSRPKRNISEDFADGVMMAEVLANFLPKLVDLSLYKEGNDEVEKQNTWRLLAQNVLSVLDIRLTEPLIANLVDARPGVIEQVLWEVRRKLMDSGPSTTVADAAGDGDGGQKMGFSFKEMSGISEIAKDRNVWKALLSELLATMLLVFIGCGTCVQWGEGTETPTTKPLIVEISFAFGIIAASLIQAFNHVSGCHMNPAVTVGCLIGGKIKPIKAMLYIIFQCVGGIAGAALLKAVTPNGGGSLGITEPHPDVSPAQAFGIEFIITFILVMVCFGSTDAYRDDIAGSIPLAIGFCITACHMAAIKYTGSSMNPARTFGPAVVGNNWVEHWVYWMGPCAGGAVAGLTYQNAFQAKKPAEPANPEYNYDPVSTKPEGKEVP